MILPSDFLTTIQNNPLLVSILPQALSLISSLSSNISSYISSSSLFIIILVLVILSIIFKFKSSFILPSTYLETFTIDLFNLPVNSLPSPSPKLILYIALVRFIKHKFKFCNSINFIADFNGKFNFLSNSSNVRLSKLITLNSSFSYNNDNFFDCSITLSSSSLPALVQFIKHASRFYQKN